jgi:hypothetical protein
MADWDKLEAIAKDSKSVEIRYFDYCHVPSRIISIPYGNGAITQLICRERGAWTIKNIFDGTPERQVTQEEAEDYLRKLVLLPPPTLPDGYKESTKCNYFRLTIHKNTYEFCIEYAMIDYKRIVMRGELITVDKKTFPYTFDAIMMASFFAFETTPVLLKRWPIGINWRRLHIGVNPLRYYILITVFRRA